MGCISLSSSIHSSLYISIVVFASGYKVNLFVELPLEINMSPDLQLMKASTVANQGLPKLMDVLLNYYCVLKPQSQQDIPKNLRIQKYLLAHH